MPYDRTETLYIALCDGTELAVGTAEERMAQSDEGSLPPREKLTLKLVGTFAK